jgi:hypothetical protein
VLPCAAFLARAAWCAEIRMRIERIMSGTAFDYTQSRAGPSCPTSARCLTPGPPSARRPKAERFIQAALREWRRAEPTPAPPILPPTCRPACTGTAPTARRLDPSAGLNDHPATSA